MSLTIRDLCYCAMLFLTACGGASTGGSVTTDVVQPTQIALADLSQTTSQTLAAFRAGAPAAGLPLLDVAALNTPGSATYTGFVAITIPYNKSIDRNIGGTIVSVPTNLQNGPVGAAKINVLFGDTPTITGRAGNFVVVSDTDLEKGVGGVGTLQPTTPNPADFKIDPSLALIAVAGELTFSGQGISTQHTIVNGVPDNATARSGLSITAKGSLAIPADVGGVAAARTLVVDSTIFGEVTKSGLSGNGTVEVNNGLEVTRIHISAQK